MLVLGFVAVSGLGHLFRNTDNLEASVIDAVDKIRAFDNKRGHGRGVRGKQGDEREKYSFELSSVSLLDNVMAIVALPEPLWRVVGALIYREVLELRD